MTKSEDKTATKAAQTPAKAPAKKAPAKAPAKVARHTYKFTVDKPVADTLSKLSEVSGFSIQHLNRIAIAHLIKVYAPHFQLEEWAAPDVRMPPAALRSQPARAHAPAQPQQHQPQQSPFSTPSNPPQPMPSAFPEPQHRYEYVPKEVDPNIPYTVTPYRG